MRICYLPHCANAVRNSNAINKIKSRNQTARRMICALCALIHSREEARINFEKKKKHGCANNNHITAMCPLLLDDKHVGYIGEAYASQAPDAHAVP